MVWQGKGSILTGRRQLGETDPAKSPVSAIRGDYSIDLGRNIIHGSDGPEGAAHEINFWSIRDEAHDWPCRCGNSMDAWLISSLSSHFFFASFLGSRRMRSMIGRVSTACGPMRSRKRDFEAQRTADHALDEPSTCE